MDYSPWNNASIFQKIHSVEKLIMADKAKTIIQKPALF